MYNLDNKDENGDSLPRLHVVDALRGFAIVSIMLLHNIEHFNLYSFPNDLPKWVTVIDRGIWDTLWFLFAGKSYAIFALLFGLTYYIQSESRSDSDFRLRFAWRLVILFFFGMFNSLFYQGDILSIYAILGFALIPFTNVSNSAMFKWAVLFMLQPFIMFQFFYALINGSELPSFLPDKNYFAMTGEILQGASLWDSMVASFTTGKAATFVWTWKVGRVFQTLSLFLFGVLAGRMQLFQVTNQNFRFWRKIFVVSILSFIVFNFLKSNIKEFIEVKNLYSPLRDVFRSWSEVSFSFMLISIFVLLFQEDCNFRIKFLTALGKMSLSNYIFQSIIGSVVYYGFGFALYMYTGPTYSFIIGLLLIGLTGLFSMWWLKHNKYGPLEGLWHKLTWIGK